MSLEDIRARDQAATEGPWHARQYLYGLVGEHMRIEGPMGLEDENIAEQVLPADAHFMANARADIPFLLDERDKLRAALDAVRERLERLEKVAEDHVQSPDQYTSGIGQGLRIAAGLVGLAIEEAVR